jgi:cytochrome c biogenesis protein CcmG/thiol:disulfide interchange protein DsbE
MMKTSLPIIVCFFLSALGGISAEESKLLPPGLPAPSFSLPTLSGDRLALSAYCGQTLSKPFINKIRHIVILSFWATYCKPCQKEIPQLKAFADKHKADNVLALCISVDKEGEAVVAPFVKEKGLTAQVLLDPYMKTSERYGVRSLPALFIIDTLGIIRYCSHGYDEKVDFNQKLERLFTDIKAGKKIATAPEKAGSEIVVQADTVVTGRGSPAPAAVSPSPVSLTPQQKWNAIVKVECGEPVEKVAATMGVTAADLRKWHEELKGAAIKLWGQQKN